MFFVNKKNDNAVRKSSGPDAENICITVCLNSIGLLTPSAKIDKPRTFENIFVNMYLLLVVPVLNWIELEK